MDNVLSLQLLGTDLSAETAACSNSSISCPSQASCQSHQSTPKADTITPGGQAW